MKRRFSAVWAFLTSDQLAWVRLFAVYVGVSIISNWLQWPLKARREFPFFWAVLAVFGVWWLLSLERVEGWLGRFNRDGSGGWRTTRAERIRRLAPLPFFAVGLLALAVLGWALWRIGDLPRVGGATAISVALLAAMAFYTLKTWRVRVELRIDEAGVFAAAWRRTYAWDDIAYAVQPGGARELRVVLTEAAAEAAGRGALLVSPLAPTGLYPNEALVALRAVRPDLPIEPWTTNGVVLPIRGAADVPDISKVRTYG